MDLRNAIYTLSIHNNWRRDKSGKLPQVNPRILGEAIDFVVNNLKNFHVKNVNQQIEDLTNFLFHLNHKSLINNHDFDYEKEAKDYCKNIIDFNDNSKTYKQKERILCPDCKGEKEIMAYNDAEQCNEFIPCPMCEGEGIVLKVTKTNYLKLSHANR